MSSCPHGLALTPWLLPVHPGAALVQVRLCPLRWQLLLVTPQGGQARTLCLQVLWKEAVALKVGPGSQSPELWFWAPTRGPGRPAGL